MIDLVKYRIVTEKTTDLANKNKYVFSVDARLTKPQIKQLFQTLLDTTIRSVNTYILPNKKKRLGLQQGYKPRYKRVVITLEPGTEFNQLFASTGDVSPEPEA